MGSFRHGRNVRARVATVAALSLASVAPAARGQSAAELLDLSLEDLSNVTITSVSRRPERLLDAAASIFVITGEDIRRSAATTLPEALRLAPNLQVARVDATSYAISARGFNNSIGNKLLVLIDGRTVYTPLFSGVFWDSQDVMLEDVERIEVISGPGATLWGANAVNGVINVITKAAKDTQGALVSAGVGNRESSGALRYGGELAGGNYRVYGKTDRIENTRTAARTAVADGWTRKQTGFRADWTGAADSFTVQGDAYSGESEQRAVPFGQIDVKGMNLLGRWTRKLSEGVDFRLQAYYDHSEHSDPVTFRPTADVFDIEFQNGIALESHKIVWGGGYRHSRDEVLPGFFFAFNPPARDLDWANLFVQDEIKLADSLQFTPGIKFEHNDYTGIEPLPSARLGWNMSERHFVWAAFSRAVRAPARLDHDIRFPANPPGLFIRGGQDFVSETANVWELGYRAQASTAFSYSATLFYTDWDRLRSGQPPPAFVQNKIEGTTEGLEAWATWQVTGNWRLTGGFTTLTEHLHTKPGSNDPTGPSALGNDPKDQWQLRSTFNLPRRQEFDFVLRHVSRLPNPDVPSYTAVDLRYGWHVTPGLEVSLTAQNLFDRSHAEFGGAGRSEIERGVFLRLRWSSR